MEVYFPRAAAEWTGSRVQQKWLTTNLNSFMTLKRSQSSISQQIWGHEHSGDPKLQTSAEAEQAKRCDHPEDTSDSLTHLTGMMGW